MDDKWLEAIIADDDLGLLNIKQTSSAPTADEHLVNNFNAISEFVAKHGKPPSANFANPIEFSLFARLNGIKENAEHVEALKPHDRFGLLD